IFEPRYRQLLLDIASGSDLGRFGVVVLHRGAEAGVVAGLPDVAEVGTLAEILEIEPGADGTSDLLAVGSRRCRVDSLAPGAAPRSHCCGASYACCTKRAASPSRPPCSGYPSRRIDDGLPRSSDTANATHSE